MDVIKFNNYIAPTKFEQGEIVNGIRSKLWVERYREEGEFSFVAGMGSGLKENLPIGTFVGHVDTQEIMIVENHEIGVDRGQDTEITVSGRSFQTLFEQRVVGSNLEFSGGDPDYYNPGGYLYEGSGYTWDVAVGLIEEHITALELYDDNDALPYVEVIAEVPGTGLTTGRLIKMGDLHTRLLEVLAREDLGVKVYRPGLQNPLGSSSVNLCVSVYRGVDRSADVLFSYDTGEIERANYLWSNKLYKNAAIIAGRWIITRVTTGSNGLARRTMFVDASDLDSSFSAPPEGGDLTPILAAMQARGTEALSNQTNIALTKAEPSKNATQPLYRTEFNVGDLITVVGDYNGNSVQRITEYAEIEDETGSNGYPTLALV